MSMLQDLINATVEENADERAAKLGCAPEEVRAAAPRAVEIPPTRAEAWAAAQEREEP